MERIPEGKEEEITFEDKSLSRLEKKGEGSQATIRSSLIPRIVSFLPSQA